MIEGSLGEIAAPDHILDRGDQERRARNDQAFIGVGEQLALRFAAASETMQIVSLSQSGKWLRLL